MRRWIRFDTDHGAILWAVLCCWLGVAANFGLIGLKVPIFYIVPFDLFGVPLVVSVLLWCLQRRRSAP